MSYDSWKTRSPDDDLGDPSMYEKPNQAQERDEGTVFIERMEDGTVQLKVRSPGAHGYSFVNMTWQEWTDLRALDPAPNEPTVAF